MRRLEEGAQGQLDAERLADPRDDLGGEQRVAAEREEVVLDADPRSSPSSSAQIAASRSSVAVRGATSDGPVCGRREVGRRQRAAGRPCRSG